MLNNDGMIENASSVVGVVDPVKLLAAAQLESLWGCQLIDGWGLNLAITGLST
jgi:hypothetical protein